MSSSTLPRALRLASSATRSLSSGNGVFRASRYACARITHDHLDAAESKSANPLATYRKIQRLLPGVLKAFEFTNVDALHRSSLTVRRMFEANRSIKDPRIVEMLLHKADQEISETILMYKTGGHVKALLLADGEQEDLTIQRKPVFEKQSPFMDTFIHGPSGRAIHAD